MLHHSGCGGGVQTGHEQRAVSGAARLTCARAAAKFVWQANERRSSVPLTTTSVVTTSAKKTDR